MFLLPATTFADASRKADMPDALADRVLKRVRKLDKVWGNYTVDLTLDALLELYEVTGDDRYRDYVMGIMFRRNIRMEDPIPYETQPFGHLNYRLWLATGDDRIKQPFVDETAAYRREAERSEDGLLLHRGLPESPPQVLVDAMQDYASRMARTGKITGDASCFEECVEQFRLYRDVLRDPENGLWRQGRAAEPGPQAIAPHAWSRGHGWILRGLTDALTALPENSSYFRALHAMCVDLLDALLHRQDEQGMWHVLPDLPMESSSPETSGTALIGRALYTGLARGWIEGRHYEQAADKAFRAVARRVDPDGWVHGVCIGPGPLPDYVDRYLETDFVPCEEHGSFSVLYLCAARLRYLNEQTNEESQRDHEK
jgi:rhamnogalacturonyl hydrolase YesR